MTLRSAIYRGEVVHTRHRPKQHKLKYRVFSLLLDIDEIGRMDRGLRLFGHNRFSLFSFFDQDHGPLDGGNLKEWVLNHARSAGVEDKDLRISILVYPRILGYVFNPLTVYFLTRPDGSTALVLYEVCNTFHERHTYVIPAVTRDGTIRHSANKELYVSPFIPMECRYDFRLVPPAEAVSIVINEEDESGPLLFAGFTGKRTKLNDRELMKAFFAYPLMTLKIMAGIHFEALRIWLKGMKVFRHVPARQRVASTLVDVDNTGAKAS
ncbi:DUF1365 domain-containing protein [Rhizobium sp. L1K21]|uniref:DUF1365 domain-containing protein n=1 Tax=Rhizobium sp. L1K21 TaxID=2954933 RepID=UPI002093D642|nr:DUF1365 family protein [Rhizobium sp. L1K21]MCO6185262.1 DUF1365 domain-containing protein [Rhizobium sp. L1K21]